MKRKCLLLVICLFSAFLLCACHVDNDPWPVDGVLTSPTATPTAVPTAVSSTEAPAQPAATQMPQPTRTPGGEEAPGLNG